MNYGKAIKIARSTRGLSQKGLAELVGLAPSYISRIEAGNRKPTTDILETISAALGIPMYLIVLMAYEKFDVKGLPPLMVSNLCESLLGVVLETQKGVSFADEAKRT